MASTKGHRRMSTNEKLGEFLHTSAIVDEAEEYLESEELKAKNRLRSTTLYGAGARFRVPRVKVSACHHYPTNYFTTHSEKEIHHKIPFRRVSGGS